MRKYSLKKPIVRNYAPVTGVLGPKKGVSKIKESTKPIIRQKKRRFGIFKKSEETIRWT